MVYDLTVKVCQNILFILLVDFFIRIFFVIWCYREIVGILLSKAVEWCVFSCSSAIESSLDGHYAPHGVIFHIVGEYHQLGDVDKSTIFLVGKTLEVHSLTFSHNTTMIVWLLDLHEAKRQSIDKQRDVRAELILTILASKFCRKMKFVVLRILEIN